MKFLFMLLALICIPPVPAPAQTAASVAFEPTASPTESRIADDRRQIQQSPAKFQPYNDLALALIARSKETGNTALIAEADDTLKKALKLAPDNIQVLKTQVALLLARFEFVQARAEAKALNERTPDDVSVYGYLATADIELGDYQDAETQAQWMLNLRPNNTPGLLVGVRLRRLYGDSEGALQFLNQAYSQTSSSEPQELAFIGEQIARVLIDSGRSDDADQVLQQVQKLFSNYPPTLEDLAEVKAIQHKYEESAALLSELNQRAPSPEVLYKLARVLAKAGKADQSRAMYAEFERAARNVADEASKNNRELILYYADGANPKEALNLASHEIKIRQDVWTLDAYAWALQANGQYAEAKAQIEKALHVSLRDAQVFYHAAFIASKLNDSVATSRYSELLIETNPSSEYAENARIWLHSSRPPSQYGPSPAINTSIPAPLIPSPSTLPSQPVVNISPSPRDDTKAHFQPLPQQLLSPKLSDTDRLIRSLQTKLARESNQYDLYAQLGAAFFQKARETGDVSDFDLAEKALRKSLDLISNDLAAATPTETLAAVYMGEHRFADALTYAEKSLSVGAGDLSPFAIVGDAYADMGEYDKASEAYNKLRSSAGEPSGRSYAQDSRISFLKFISGDTESAIQFMQYAIGEGVAAHLPSENLAWLYYELGEYCFQDGKAAAANDAYLTALNIHPGDYRALAALARLRANQGFYQDAVELYQKALDVVPMPLFAAELGDLYNKLGQPDEAQKQFQLVEYIGTLGAINQTLHNRDLALFYADHDKNLDRALELAKKEFEVRHDIYTWDVLAWALFKNGKLVEAADAMDKALRFNTKDALLLFHAGMIYQAMGEEAKARDYLSKAIAINSHFHVLYADQALQQLARLSQQLAQSQNGKAADVH